MELLRNIKKFQQQVTCAVEECLESECLCEERFEEICQILDNESLKNISEERALSQKCGYPLCNRLISLKEQKYKIYSNRVFDVTQRNLFCSDYCYKRFLYVEKQLPTEPYWITGDRKRFSIEFLKAVDEKTKNDVRGAQVHLDPATDLIIALEELKILDDSDDLKTVNFDDKSEQNSSKQIPKVKLIEEIDLKSDLFLVDDEENDENLSVRTAFVQESDSDEQDIEVDKDNLCGWSSSKPLVSPRLPSEQALNNIRRKYFNKNKTGLTLKKRPVPQFIEPKAFPKNVLKEKSVVFHES